MQKLNLSALKKQPVDTSSSATQSVQTVSTQVQPISVTPVLTVETPHSTIIPNSQTQSTEIIKIDSTHTDEPKASVSIPATREFFPNL
jgi:hypothetical protein